MSEDRATKQWDKYVEEAEIEPFRLGISPEEVLPIEQPSGIALLRIAQGMRTGDLELLIRSLVGEHWDRIQTLLGGAGHKALPALVEDLMDHFDLYEDITFIAPNGSKVTARRPIEIQKLLNQGFRPAGEAQSS